MVVISVHVSSLASNPSYSTALLQQYCDYSLIWKKAVYNTATHKVSPSISAQLDISVNSSAILTTRQQFNSFAFILCYWPIVDCLRSTLMITCEDFSLRMCRCRANWSPRHILALTTNYYYQATWYRQTSFREQNT